eukprot:PLAT5312.1.p2 GENE.PLAT5312.1~~PLAT5312.1.p2  ORF type:complete len:336 (-),score=148.10 PLAT5312.1:31-1038(-)
MVRKRDDGKIYAMKVLKKKNIFEKRQEEHTRSERRILEEIDHPFIVSLRYAFQTPDKLYLVMDYANGGELFVHLQRAGKFDEKLACFYAAEILEGLAHLHGLGIVYRDLKPENILLDHRGHLKITDFGLSKHGVGLYSGASTFCGSPEYVAPEVLKRKPYGRAIDWWSFGVVLHELLTGLPPFYDRNVKRMHHNILYGRLRLGAGLSEQAAELIAGLLVKSPRSRLGCRERGVDELREHPFFASINWDDLRAQRTVPPFRPRVSGETDVRHFAEEFTTELPRDTPAAPGVLSRVRHDVHFQDFSFAPKGRLDAIVASAEDVDLSIPADAAADEDE